MKNKLVNFSLLIGVLGFLIILIPIILTLSHESIIRIAFVFGIFTIILSILGIIFNKNKTRGVLVLFIGIFTILLTIFYNYYINSDSKILNKIDRLISGNKIDTNWDETPINDENDDKLTTTKKYNSLLELKNDYNIDVIISNYLITDTKDEYSAYLPVTVTNNDNKRITLDITITATNKKNLVLGKDTVYIDSLPQTKSQKFKAFIKYDANETNYTFGSNIKDVKFQISSITLYTE